MALPPLTRRAPPPWGETDKVQNESAKSIAWRVTGAERAVVGVRGVRSNTAGAVPDVNIAGLVVVADI